MKCLILILTVSLFSCTKNSDDLMNQDNRLSGTWKLIEFFGSDGSTEPQWIDIENGYSYTFDADNVLISNRFECNGTYESNLDRLTISFECANTQFNMSSDMSFENDILILTPNPLNCDEGCSEKYQRIELQ